jgi:hypothetical protein
LVLLVKNGMMELTLKVQMTNVKVQNSNGIVEWWKNGMEELRPKIQMTKSK